MTADDVRAALRRRHPAEQHMGTRIIPGPWTTIEEWMGIDLLALSAHATPANGKVPGVQYPRVGYEIKVSRSDFRRELLRPGKRLPQVAWCNAFYIAVPRGLLTADEIAYDEPEWAHDDFERTPCPLSVGPTRPRYTDDPGPCVGGKRYTLFIGPLEERYPYRDQVEIRCDACAGRGYAEKSRVEREAPTLWVPRDVGLVEIDGRGCHVAKKAPTRREVPAIEAGAELARFARWVSARPDPRHPSLYARAKSDA